jgi:hypothetical protein
VHLRKDAEPLELDVERVRLMFFYDVDIALFALEIVGNDVPLPDAVETMDRFGRPYPPSWEQPGRRRTAPGRWNSSTRRAISSPPRTTATARSTSRWCATSSRRRCRCTGKT